MAITVNQVQEAIVQTLKASASVLALISTSGEIKENQWQGTHYIYPCIRVSIENLTTVRPNCSLYIVDYVIQCYSENESSKQSNNIADTVLIELDKDFTYNGIKLTTVRSVIIPAYREDEKTWQSRVNLTSLVQKTV